MNKSLLKSLEGRINPIFQGNKVKGNKHFSINWVALEGKQQLVFDYITNDNNNYNIVGFGGSRGIGKSEIGINSALFLMYKLGIFFNGVYLRNTSKDLTIDIILRLELALARDGLKKNKDYTFNKTTKQLVLLNGARLLFHYVENGGMNSLQGANITHCFVEEPQYMKDLHDINTRLQGVWRTTEGVVKKQVWCFNPLGVGTSFLKEKFVDKGNEPFFDENKNKCVFVKAEIKDNPKLDSQYIASLENMPEAYKNAWFHGNFDITTGLAFPMLNLENNGFRDDTFRPDLFKWFISLDWGYHDPTIVGFYCITDNKAIIKFDEMVLLQKTPDEVGHFIKLKVSQLDKKRMVKCVADSQIHNISGLRNDPTETIADCIFKNSGIIFAPATKNRQAGYLKMYSLIKNRIFFIDEKCKYFWNSVPKLQLDDNPRFEADILSSKDDHSYDETRYALMNAGLFLND